MTDIFREVDEDLRRERLKGVWSQYGRYIIAAAVLVVVGVAGWRIYGSMQAQNAAASGDRYNAALQLAIDGDLAGAEAALADLSDEAAAGYGTLSRMREASLIAENGDATQAAAAFDVIANDGSVDASLRDVARLRAALLLVDTRPFTEIEDRLIPLDASDQEDARTKPFRFVAREIMATSAIRAGEYARARELLEKSFQELIGSASEGAALQRASLLLAIIDSHLPREPATQNAG